LQLIDALERPTSTRSLSVRTKTVHTPQLVEEEGVWASISRRFGEFFGKKEWGRKRIVHEETRVEGSETARQMETFRDRTFAFLDAQLRQIDQGATAQAKALEAELGRQREDLERKSKTRLEFDRRRDLSRKLAELMAPYKGHLSPVVPVAGGRPQRYAPQLSREVRASALFSGVVSMAHRVLEIHREGLLDAALRDDRAARIGSKTSRAILLWGWDLGELETFRALFLPRFGDGRAAPSEAGDGLREIDGGEEGKLVLLDEQRATRNDVARVKKLLGSSEAVTLLFLDAGQPGAAESALHRSKLRDCVQSSALVCVAQSVAELASANAVAEGFLELRRLVDDWELAPRGALVSHPAPIYSYLFRHILLGFEDLVAPRAIEDFYAALAKIEGPQDLPIGQWLKDWQAAAVRNCRRSPK
jgi:hypothetical protein